MKGYRARYTPEAAERIRKFHPQVKQEIKEGIRELLISPLAGHALQFELAGLRSYRVRTYRIIYRILVHVAMCMKN
ncbi:MAG: type II toxin-antitoxin system RelE/ParE family toxin [Nitrospira sp. LK70]|nr:type II toxin-antitoxin system RelE/ParE family toxin [Nitrospira sp. LK70]